MTDKNILPEERLFRIIQKENTAGSGPVVAFEETKKKSREWLRGIKNLFRRRDTAPAADGYFSSGRHFKFNLKFHDINLRVVNTALIAVLCFLLAAILYYFFDGRPGVEQLLNSMPKGQAPLAFTAKTIESFKDPSFFADEAKKRNVFRQILEESGKFFVQTFAPEPSESLKNLISGLKLQGITWGRVSKVMIYDEKEGKIYFLKEGDAIGSTDVKIKTIFRNKIVVSYGESEMEMM